MEKHKPAISIMLVERDELALQVLAWLFEKAGYMGELLLFTDPAKATEHLNTHKLPDLLVADFFLNKMEAFSFLLRAQELAISWNKTMPIVILGDFATDKKEMLAIMEDVNFVLKPLTIDAAEKWIGLLH